MLTCILSSPNIRCFELVLEPGSSVSSSPGTLHSLRSSGVRRLTLNGLSLSETQAFLSATKACPALSHLSLTIRQPSKLTSSDGDDDVCILVTLTRISEALHVVLGMHIRISLKFIHCLCLAFRTSFVIS